jgi:hypothetical protein
MDKPVLSLRDPKASSSSSNSNPSGPLALAPVIQNLKRYHHYPFSGMLESRDGAWVNFDDLEAALRVLGGAQTGAQHEDTSVSDPWMTIIDHHRAMALRFAESRDELKHENRTLKQQLAQQADRIAELEQPLAAVPREPDPQALSPRDRARRALTVLIHETGGASVRLSGITLADVKVDLETIVADAIADAVETALAGRPVPPQEHVNDKHEDLDARVDIWGTGSTA